MGYADEFIIVKQFDRLYEECMEAGAAYEAYEYVKGYDHVCKAFGEMLLAISDHIGKSVTQLFEDNLFTPLSARNYQMYAVLESGITDIVLAPEEYDTSFRDGPYIALQEEIRKFAMYYVHGATPSSISEINSGLYGSRTMSKSNRVVSDFVFMMVLTLGAFVAGAVLLIISALSEEKSNLFVSGMLAIAFGVLLLVVNAKFRK